MIEVIQGDLLKHKTDILVHGVNCRGKMASGIALAIRKLYPKVYTDYIEMWSRYYREPEFLLGKVIYTEINSGLIIASAFTQLNYGYCGKKYVSYDAVDTAFADINHKAVELNMVIKFPMIGCGLGGGNWNIVSKIIEENQSPNVRCILFNQ